MFQKELSVGNAVIHVFIVASVCLFKNILKYFLFLI